MHYPHFLSHMLSLYKWLQSSPIYHTVPQHLALPCPGAWHWLFYCCFVGLWRTTAVCVVSAGPSSPASALWSSLKNGGSATHLLPVISSGQYQQRPGVFLYASSDVLNLHKTQFLVENSLTPSLVSSIQTMCMAAVRRLYQHALGNT